MKKTTFYKKKLKEIFNSKTIIILFLIFIVCTFFLFYNNKFNHPLYDDWQEYNQYVEIRADRPMTLSNYFKINFERIQNKYNTWQGTYASYFIINSVLPILFKDNVYPFLSFISQIFIFLCIFLSFYFLKKSDFFDSLKSFVVVAIVYIIYIINFAHHFGEFFYYFPAMAVYSIPFAVSLVYISLLFLFINKENLKKKKTTFVALIFLLIFLCGTNYSTGILVCLITFLFFLKETFSKKTKTKELLFLVIIAAIFFGLNVFAPGNNFRKAHFEEISIINALLMTIPHTINTISYLLFETVLVPTFVIFLPLVKKLINKTKYKYDKPLLVFVVSTVIMCLLFAPYTYSYGTYYIEHHALTIIKYYFIVYLFINYYYILGYLLKNKKIKLENKNDYVFKLVGFIGLIAIISSVGIENFKGHIMYDEYINKVPQKYDECMNKFENDLKDENLEIVVIKNCEVYSRILHNYPFGIYSNDEWIIETLEEFYKKKITFEK